MCSACTRERYMHPAPPKLPLGNFSASLRTLNDKMKNIGDFFSFLCLHIALIFRDYEQRELLMQQKVEIKSSHLQAIIPETEHRKKETGHGLSAFQDSISYIQMQRVSGFKIIVWTSVMVNLLCNYYYFIFTKLGIDCFPGTSFLTTRFFSKRQNPAHMPQDWFWGRKEKEKKC